MHARFHFLFLALASLGGCVSDPGNRETPEPGWALAENSPLGSIHFMDASFISPAEGWLIDFYGGIYHTSDGGQNWDLRLGVPAGDATFRSVWFLDASHGFRGDLNDAHLPLPRSSLWETGDGGRTWTNITDRVSGPDPVGLCSLFAVDDQTIYGVGRWHGPAVFVRSTDGGISWESVDLAPLITGAVDLFFFDRLNGIVVGGRDVGYGPAEQAASRTVVLSTSDGGTTWSERFVGNHLGYWAWKISFPTRRIGYVATQGPTTPGRILKTGDGGLTWREIVVPNTGGFAGIGFIDSLHGWIGEYTGAMETLDGGQTWHRVPWAGHDFINRFRILDPARAYAMGERVYVFSAEDP